MMSTNLSVRKAEHYYNAPDVQEIAHKATTVIVDPVVMFRGEKGKLNPFNEWADVTNAVDYWRDLLKFRICTVKGRADCKPPKA